MKKLLSIILVISLGVKSFAFIFGGGGALNPWDYPNYIANLQAKAEAVKQTIQQIEQTKNQILSLENQAKNLIKMDKSLSINSLQGLQDSLNTLIYLSNNTKSIIKTTNDISDKFPDLYQNSVEALGISDLMGKEEELINELNNVIYDSLQSTSIVDPNKYNNDYERINALISVAGTSEGSLEALQASSQIAGETASHLMEIKKIQAQQTKLMASFIASEGEQKRLEEAKNKKRVEDYFKDDYKISTPGVGDPREYMKNW